VYRKCRVVRLLEATLHFRSFLLSYQVNLLFYFLENLMSVQKQQQSFTSTPLRIVAILAFFAVMLLTDYATSMAQPCMPGCGTVSVSNCSASGVGVNIIFITCCDGVQGTINRFVDAAPVFGCSYITCIPPFGCTIIGAVYGGSIPPGFPPPPNWVFNPATCTLDMW
jgi:hypothetical protein